MWISPRIRLMADDRYQIFPALDSVQAARLDQQRKSIACSRGGLAAPRHLRRANNRDQPVSGVRLCETKADLKGNDLQSHELNANRNYPHVITRYTSVNSGKGSNNDYLAKPRDENSIHMCVAISKRSMTQNSCFLPITKWPRFIISRTSLNF
jgi:hypothetical protein